jgi:hypothetical protein
MARTGARGAVLAEDERIARGPRLYDMHGWAVRHSIAGQGNPRARKEGYRSLPATALYLMVAYLASLTRPE